MRLFSKFYPSTFSGLPATNSEVRSQILNQPVIAMSFRFSSSSDSLCFCQQVYITNLSSINIQYFHFFFWQRQRRLQYCLCAVPAGDDHILIYTATNEEESHNLNYLNSKMGRLTLTPSFFCFFFTLLVLIFQVQLTSMTTTRVAAIAVAVAHSKLNLWPMPASVNHGRHKLLLDKHFQLTTRGSNYVDASGILKDAFFRMLNLINIPHIADANASLPHQSSLLRGINVLVLSPHHQV